MCWCWWWGATDSDISCLFYPWENLNESYNCRGLIDDNSLFSFFLFFVFLLWGGGGVKTNMRTESGESKWQHTEGICVSAIGESLYISISHSLHCQCCFFIQPSDRLHTARVCSDCVCVCEGETLCWVMAIIQHPLTVRQTGSCVGLWVGMLQLQCSGEDFLMIRKQQKDRREISLLCVLNFELLDWCFLAGHSSQTPVCKAASPHTFCYFQRWIGLTSVRHADIIVSLKHD